MSIIPVRKNMEGAKGLEHVLAIDYEKCTGCRNCELACSVAHYNEFSPSRARIQVIKQETRNIVAPVVCLQCASPLCQKACPNEAIVKNEYGILYVKSDTCIGCGNCVAACVYGGITIDPKTKKAIKCDHCSGDPACAKACEYGAITYETKDGLQVRHKGTESVMSIVVPLMEDE
ncbi:MAG: 4Fe-4S dicluster domain-containing protein [Candidatus Thorarchaeota archaeon]|nr:4Fe-4S dicluster domain-containing protein [Candidatus Thorarchaeota archaeon]